MNRPVGYIGFVLQILLSGDVLPLGGTNDVELLRLREILLRHGQTIPNINTLGVIGRKNKIPEEGP